MNVTIHSILSIRVYGVGECGVWSLQTLVKRAWPANQESGGQAIRGSHLNNCTPTKLEDINQAQQERLFHIDFKLRFLGAVNRNDLVSRFGIKVAAATRDIALYK